MPHHRVTIIRHWKERLSKCSLTPLSDMDDFEFIKASKGFSFDATGYTFLGLEGRAIGEKDAERPLLILDSTWRLLPALVGGLKGTPEKRTLPENIKTAYPRESKVFNDPMNGLASIEALYAAMRLMGLDAEGILDKYTWKNRFLQLNPGL